MELFNLQQNTEGWDKFRADHYTASEAPAMKGASKFQTRNDLLNAKKYGFDDPTWFQEKLWADGHKAEEAARAMAEEIVGEALYPVTGRKEGTKLTASFDGLTLDQRIAWEHKAYNKELIETLKNTGPLDPHYIWQLEQQAYVSDAKKILFMCSDGTRENGAYIWYEPKGLSKDLLDGWAQFEADLKNYQAPNDPPPIETKPIESLPALRVSIIGNVKSSNLAEYKEKALGFVESINTDLQTDEDFANAEQLIKFCGKAEKDIKAAKEQALSQTADIYDLLKALDEVSEAMRKKRLAMTKSVATEKSRKRQNLIDECNSELIRYIDDLFLNLPKVNLNLKADFVGAAKNKKTIKSLRDATQQELADAKIRAKNAADLVQQNYAAIPEDKKILFSDFNHIALQPHENFTSLVSARLSVYEAEQKTKEEARIKKEREAKERAKQASTKAEEWARQAAAKREADEQARREADQKHREAVHAEIIDYLVSSGFSKNKSAMFVDEVSTGLVPHVEVKY